VGIIDTYSYVPLYATGLRLGSSKCRWNSSLMWQPPDPHQATCMVTGLQDVAAALFDSLGDAAQKDYLLRPGNRSAIITQHHGTAQTLAGASALAPLLADRGVALLHFRLGEDGGLLPCQMESAGPAAAAMAAAASVPAAAAAAAAASASAAACAPAVAAATAAAAATATSVPDAIDVASEGAPAAPLQGQAAAGQEDASPAQQQPHDEYRHGTLEAMHWNRLII